MGKDETKQLIVEYKHTHPNILHGDGWMFEYELAKEQWAKRKAAFLTFGSFMDPAKVDLIIISNSLDEKIKLNIDYDKIMKETK